MVETVHGFCILAFCIIVNHLFSPFIFIPHTSAIYRILRTGQILKVRLTVTEIRRIIDRFDQDGLPFYLVTAGTTVVISPSNGRLQP